MFEPHEIKPNGDRLLLHKCEHDDVRDDETGDLLLVLPDKTKDTTNFCKVLAVGPKCEGDWPVGAIVRVLSDWGTGLHEVPDTRGEFWLADESLIEPFIYG